MSTYEGQYEPKDSRDVTLADNRAPGEPERTGPREGETRQQEQQSDGADKPADDRTADDPEKAHVAYGNSTDRKGQMEQDIATGNAASGDAVVGETAKDPAVRTKADANRAISGD